MAQHVCPWWIGYLLISPLRRLVQNPRQILAPYVTPGMIALDAGCGMGFFSLDMAGMAGPEGRVVCVDLQPRMIKTLVRRASKAGLLDRIECRVCDSHGLGLEDLADRVDFALAYAIVHELPDAEGFFRQIREALRQGGNCLIAEPKGHVPGDAFERTIALAERTGLSCVSRPEIRRSRAALLRR